VVDVTLRYTSQWSRVLTRRTVVSEAWLQDYLSQLNKELRFVLEPQEQHLLQQRQALEAAELQGFLHTRDAQVLPERQSGSKEWRLARGETSFALVQEADLSTGTALLFSMDSCVCNGSAYVDDNQHIVLTQDVPDQCGSAFSVVECSLADGMVARLRVHIGKENGEAADGMAIVWQPSGYEALGRGRSGLGYDGLQHSLAIELDTYCNGDMGDPSFPHISVHTRGALPNSSNHAHSIACAPIASFGHDLLVHIMISPRGEVQVWLKSPSQKEWSHVLQATIPPQHWNALCTMEGWMGVTAATGGLSCAHKLLDMHVYSL
jgi:hypothetical protein